MMKNNKGKQKENKKVNIYSIRSQILITSLGILLGVLLVAVFVTTHYLDDFYLMNKQSILNNTYQYLNNHKGTFDFEDETFKKEMRRIHDVYGVSAIIIDANSQLVQSSGADAQLMCDTLLDHVFGPVSNTYKTLYKCDKYQTDISKGTLEGVSFIEIWGTLDNGNLFMARSTVDEIKLSARLANVFFVLIVLLAAIISIILYFVFSKKITSPLVSITELSKKMANLDFEYRYDGKEKSEIGVLGLQLNEMSSKLEQAISDLKTANLELQKDIEKKEQIDEMRKEFLSGVSHELKTPLALIMGYAEGLKEDVSNDNASRDFYCDVIIDESNKMNEMVKKLLTLNQLEFGNETITMERFDLTDMIRSYIENASLLFKNENIHVEFQHKDPCYVWGDEFMIEEVLRNYLSNAIHFVNDKKLIRVSMKEEKEKVRVLVYNSGDLIPEESIPRLFERFYKVDKARTREYGGSGIGLSIVKVIMDNMHQACGVNNLEDGVEFWFELATK